MLKEHIVRRIAPIDAQDAPTTSATKQPKPSFETPSPFQKTQATACFTVSKCGDIANFKLSEDDSNYEDYPCEEPESLCDVLMTLAACNEESEEDQAPYSRIVSNGLAWDSENLEVCKQETAVSRKSKLPHQPNCYKTETADHRTRHAISKDKVGGDVISIPNY